MSSLSGPVRATLGLVVVTVENARILPGKVIEVPVTAVSSVLQLSLRAQQRYAELTMRGDQLLGWLRGAPEEAPEWATFDEPPSSNGRAAASTSEPARPQLSAEDAPTGTDKPARRKRSPAKRVTKSGPAVPTEPPKG